MMPIYEAQAMAACCARPARCSHQLVLLLQAQAHAIRHGAPEQQVAVLIVTCTHRKQGGEGRQSMIQGRTTATNVLLQCIAATVHAFSTRL